MSNKSSTDTQNRVSLMFPHARAMTQLVPSVSSWERGGGGYQAPATGPGPGAEQKGSHQQRDSTNGGHVRAAPPGLHDPLLVTAKGTA